MTKKEKEVEILGGILGLCTIAITKRKHSLGKRCSAGSKTKIKTKLKQIKKRK